MSWARWLPLVLLPVVPLAQRAVDTRRDAAEPDHQRLYLRSGDRLRKLVPGYENVLADVYWLRTVQYFR